MPSLIGHTFVAAGTTALVVRTPVGRAMPWRSWVIVLAAVSNAPDLDVVMFNWFPYAHPLGHRGFGHSLVFAAAATLLLTVGLYLRGVIRGDVRTAAWVWLISAIVMGSHGLLDAMTDGGLGIALLSPFDTTRYFFPVRPIPVAPLNPVEMFHAYTLKMVGIELLLFGPPCLAALVAATAIAQRAMLPAVRWAAVTVLLVGNGVVWVLAARQAVM